MQKKMHLVSLILTDLNRQLEAMNQSAKAAHEAATHEESKSEDSHDTRGLEASYLAGAQMARIESLKKTITAFQFLVLRDFKSTEPIELGALVELKSEKKSFYYFLLSFGGGMNISFEGKNIQVISPQSPMGEMLLGQKVGEVFEVEGARLSREYEIVSIE
jgi:transcription elongation GreA/GreB family factor